MRQKTLLLTAAAFLAAAGNLFAQNWNMVISLSNGTKDTMAVKDVTDVTFFEATKPQDPAEAIGIKWIKVEPGTFEMGSPASEDGADPDETQHTVTLTKGYYISKYPITFEQYDKFCEATGREKPKDFNWGRGKRPVVDVTWNDAQAFCEWLGCRLLTEAEWEYACRAGTTTPFSTGDNVTTDQANYDGTEPYKDYPEGIYRGRTTEVDELDNENPWGICDMHGNIYEWCADVYDNYPSTAVTDPTGPATGNDRVMRGGSWGHNACFARSANRFSDFQTMSANNVGFRVARDL